MPGDEEAEQRDRKVFEFLHQAHHSDFKGLELNLLALLINFVLVGWGWGGPKFLQLWPALVLPQQLFLGCVGLFGLLLLQFVIGVLYQRQLFILLQVKVFRFVLLCPMLSYCLQQLQSSSLGPLYGIIGVLFAAAAFILNYMAYKQSYSERSLHKYCLFVYSTSVPRSLQLLPLELCILLLQNTDHERQQQKAYTLFVSLLVAFLMIRQYLTDSVQVKVQLRLHKVLLCSHSLLILSVLAYQMAEGQLEPLTHGVITAMGLALVFIAGILKSYQKPWLLFAATEQICESFLQYIETAQMALEEADQKASDKEYLSSKLLAYVYQHCKKCNEVDCPVKLEMCRVEMTQFASAHHLLRMPGRFVRKLNIIFQQQHKERPESLVIKMSHLKLVLMHSRHKSKGLELITEIEDSSKSWNQSFMVYSMKKKVEALDSGFMEAGEQARLEADINLFRYDIYFTLNLMMDFWSQFFEERVDLSKLISISAKLFPFRQETEQLWRRIRQVDSFSTAHTMLMYAEYVRQILNNDQQTERILEEAERMKGRLRDDKTIRLKEQEQMGVMILSLNDVNLGDIKQVNSYAANLFGYVRKEALRKRINDFMPKVFAQHHDGYLQKFTSNRNKSVNTDQRVLLGRHHNRYIFPIKLQLRRQFSNYSEDILFMASIKQVKFRRPELYCIIDEQGNISDLSANWKYFFKIEGDSTCIESIVKNFWSLICNQDALSNSFLVSLNLKQWGRPYWNVDLYITSLGFVAENCGYMIRGELTKNSEECRAKRQGSEEEQSIPIGQTQLQFELTNSGFLGQYVNPSKKGFLENGKTLPLAMDQEIEEEREQKVFENYGIGIKTYRVSDSQLYRVEEDPDPNWDDYDFDGPDNNDSEKRQLLESAKEDSLKNRGNRVMKGMRYFIHFMAAGLIATVLYQYFSDAKSFQIELERLSDNQHKARAQTLASYLVSSIVAHRLGLNVPSDATPIDELRTSLQQQLNLIDIDSEKKERIMKLIYLHENDSIETFLDDNTLEFEFTEADDSPDTPKIVEAVVLPLGVLAIILLEKLYQRIQLTIFSIFLQLDQKLIKRLYNNCSQFVRRIEKESDRSDQITVVQPLEDQEDVEQHADNHKTKKLKNSGRMNRAFLIKVFIVLLLILSIVACSFIVGTKLDEDTGNAQSLLDAVLHMTPSSSMLLMRSMLQYELKLKQPPAQDAFFSRNYQYADVVVGMLPMINQGITAQITSILYQTMCVNNIVTNSTKCQSAFNGVLNLGGSNAVSQFTRRIRLLQQDMSAGSFNSSATSELFQLEYIYFKPLMDKLIVLTTQAATLRISIDMINHHIMVAVMLLMIVLGDYLTSKYVIGRMLKELHLTHQLINFIPSFKEPPRGYAALPQK